MRRKFTIGLSACAMLVIIASAMGEAKIEEQIVGPAFDQGTIYTLSPRGMHVATAGMKGSRWAVTVDGVEGPKVDAILMNAVEIVEPERMEGGILVPERVKASGPVAFSRDGTRHAYAARVGKEVIVYLDGQEVYRGAFTQDQMPINKLSFTEDGKHLLFFARTTDTMRSYQLCVDGKPVDAPAFDVATFAHFSPDGSRWAIQGAEPANTGGKHLIIDGKKVDYTGIRVRFTPDNRAVCIEGDDTFNRKQRLLVDGQPMLENCAIENLTISSTSDIGVVAHAAGAEKKMAYVNGKPLAGTEDAYQLAVSPDGKRWAATCVMSPASWVVVDGKKQQEYQVIRDVAFSPDSSRILYIAEAASKKFVVVDGNEQDGNIHIAQPPIFAKTGNHYAYCAGQGPGAIQPYYDGKVLPKSYLVHNLTLSPDGEHYAYFGANDALSAAFFFDGEAKGGVSGQGTVPIFSPDSKHVAAFAQSPTDRNANIYIDGGYIALPQGAGYPKLLGFTSDSQHVIFEATETAANRVGRAYYIDGKRVALLSGMGVQWFGTSGPTSWETQDDGSVVFVGAEPVEQGYGPMKRIRVTPDPASNVTTLVSDYTASVAQAAADAQAAKEKAEMDRKAAAEKAAADQKAAYEKALAERKAAHEKALADRKAAYDKAIADRKAAQEKAAADKAAAAKQPVK